MEKFKNGKNCDSQLCTYTVTYWFSSPSHESPCGSCHTDELRLEVSLLNHLLLFYFRSFNDTMLRLETKTPVFLNAERERKTQHMLSLLKEYLIFSISISVYSSRLRKKNKKKTTTSIECRCVNFSLISRIFLSTISICCTKLPSCATTVEEAILIYIQSSILG